MVFEGRVLHFVFKIADRLASTRFYRDILGMRVLRHEEFSEGCEAACNGPYANRWSKTMIGYGPEDSHFVMELTYNYTVKKYELGNDFLGIVIRSREAIERAQELDYPMEEHHGAFMLEAPDGYKFFLINEPQPTNKDPVEKVTLASSNLENTINYWNGLLGLSILNQTKTTATFAYSENQALLEFRDVGHAINHAKAYGRIAFACPKSQLPEIQKKIEEAKQTVLTPLISLDTPGKATVHVVILADPDKHEICFVDQEGFHELSQVDPEADAQLNLQMSRDKSADVISDTSSVSS